MPNAAVRLPVLDCATIPKGAALSNFAGPAVAEEGRELSSGGCGRDCDSGRSSGAAMPTGTEVAPVSPRDEPVGLDPSRRPA